SSRKIKKRLEQFQPSVGPPGLAPITIGAGTFCPDESGESDTFIVFERVFVLLTRVRFLASEYTLSSSFFSNRSQFFEHEKAIGFQELKTTPNQRL
ncbi:MAG TPA: hypothetical protein DCL81_19825, partial [Algoriphagus sp.]|nr:hypothetical protein [Algoriphagus sp.]